MENAGKDGGALPKEDWGYYEDEFGEEEPPEKDSDDFSDYEDYSSKKKKGKAKAKGKGVSAVGIGEDDIDGCVHKFENKLYGCVP